MTRGETTRLKRIVYDYGRNSKARRKPSFFVWRRVRDSTKPPLNATYAVTLGLLTVFWVQLVDTITNSHQLAKNMSDHLVNRKGTWHVRLAIPVDVQQSFGGRTVLTKSLRTRNRSEAQRRKHEFLALWGSQIQQARVARALPEGWQDEITDIVQSITQGARDAKRRAIGEDVQLPDIGELNLSPEILEKPEVVEFFSLLSELQEELGDTIDGKIKFQELLAENFLDALEPMYLKRFDFTDESQTELLEIIDDPQGYKPKSPITEAILSQWEVYLTDEKTDERTKGSHLSKIRRLSAHLNETGDLLEFDTVHNFIKSVSSSGKTRQMYLWSGRTFWDWGITYHPQFRARYKAQPNPFTGHKISKKSKKTDSWVPFEKKEVRDLYNQALSENDTQLSDLIVFASYTGARISEIGNLTLEDLIYDKSQIIAFNIEDAKTTSGNREVPVHTKLAPLITKLAEEASTHGGYLFKSGRNRTAKRLDYLSKRFGRLKNRLNFSKNHVFHSLRKTFTTELYRAGVSSDMLPYLIGHKHHSFTLDIYSGGPTFKQKWDDIHKIVYDFTPHY